MENQKEKNMENEMETGIIWGLWDYGVEVIWFRVIRFSFIGGF